jgi:hypothetical protein
MPTARIWEFTFLSLPVAFQYPALVARLVLDPFGYLRSRGLKKYHSRSLLGNNDFPTICFNTQVKFITFRWKLCQVNNNYRRIKHVEYTI